jgi:hypothetical protein
MIGSSWWTQQSERAERDGRRGGETDWHRGIEHQTLGLELYARQAGQRRDRNGLYRGAQDVGGAEQIQKVVGAASC